LSFFEAGAVIDGIPLKEVELAPAKFSYNLPSLATVVGSFVYR